MAMFDFTNRVVIVTGAGGGIGSEAAKAFAAHGAMLSLFDMEEKKADMEAVAAALRAQGTKVITNVCDNTKEEDIKQGVQNTVDEYGKIDVLLNNAGMGGGGAVETMDADYWDTTMNTNVRGPMLLSKYVVPHMKEKQYGRIIHVASVNAVFGEKNDRLVRVPYCTSKSAIVGLTISMATYLGKHGIVVNAVAPGVTDTDQPRSSLLRLPGFEDWYQNHNPISRIAQPEEICSTFLYLAAEETSYTNGQLIVVDGGFTLA